MPKDNLIRFCLVSIVLLLVLIACQRGPSTSVLAADAGQYLVTDERGRVREDLTKELNDMRAKGWKLQEIKANDLRVWYK